MTSRYFVHAAWCVLIGCLLATSAEATPNRPIYFNGTSTTIELPDDARLGLNQIRTVEAWYKPNTCRGQNNSGLNKFYSLYAHYYTMLFCEAGRIGFQSDPVGDTTWQTIKTRELIPDGEWSHVAMTLTPIGDVFELRLYLNGKVAELVGAEVDPNNTTVALVKLGTLGDSETRIVVGGKRPSGLEGPVDGAMDEVRLWTTPRTSLDIMTTLFDTPRSVADVVA